jgi:FimV-like protein
MKSQTTQEQRIEAYLLDTMSMDERTRFAEEMKLDETLARQVQLQRAAYAASETHAEDRLVKGFAKWEWKHSLPRKLFPLVAAATTVAGIAALYLAWKYWPRAHDHFAENFETYTASAAGQASPAMESYSAGRYDESALLFEGYLKEDSPDPVPAFFAGVSYLSQDTPNATKAISHLRLAALQDGDLQEEAEWYLALAYFEGNDEAKARNILQVIATTADHPYEEQAQAILGQL